MSAERTAGYAGRDRLRIDRWLWCTRFFKSRSGAAEAVRAGHVRCNGQRIKPAYVVKVGDLLDRAPEHRSESEVRVTAIPARRGPALEAAGCYAETESSIVRRRREEEQRAGAPRFDAPTRGRPDKRTRRLLLRTQRGPR